MLFANKIINIVDQLAISLNSIIPEMGIWKNFKLEYSVSCYFVRPIKLSETRPK